MLGEERVRLDAKGRLRLPDHQIGVVAAREATFAPPQPRKFCWFRAHPARDVVETRAAGARFGPHRGKAEPERRNTAPGTHEVAPFAVLEARHTRTVVGDHEIDEPFEEPFPQSLAVVALADGGSTFVF